MRDAIVNTPADERLPPVTLFTVKERILLEIVQVTDVNPEIAEQV